jgi:formate dehydrogenase major subunit
VTSNLSDWATNCPEYKVTAVEVTKVRTADAPSSEASVRRRQQPQERSKAEPAEVEEV